MRIAVAMSTFNDVERTQLAIDSARSQTIDATIDVVVADDGSEPAAVDALAAFIGDDPHVHLLAPFQRADLPPDRHAYAG